MDPCISFLADMVKIPSVNGTDSEKNVAQRIVQECETLGLKYQVIAKDPNRPNVLVTFGRDDQPLRYVLFFEMIEFYILWVITSKPMP